MSGERLEIRFDGDSALCWLSAWLLRSRFPDLGVAVLAGPSGDLAEVVPAAVAHHFAVDRERMSRLERFCEEQGVAFERSGRLFLAPLEESAILLDAYQAGLDRGGNGYIMLRDSLEERVPGTLAERGLLDVDGCWLDLAGLTRQFANLAHQVGVQRIESAVPSRMTVGYAEKARSVVYSRHPAPEGSFGAMVSLLPRTAEELVPIMQPVGEELLFGPSIGGLAGRIQSRSRQLNLSARTLGELRRIPKKHSEVRRLVQARAGLSGLTLAGTHLCLPGDPDPLDLFQAAEKICGLLESD